MFIACSGWDWREELVSTVTLAHCHSDDPDQIRSDLMMFSHLNVGLGAACTGQVKLCSERTVTVTAGSTLLEAWGGLRPIGSKISRLKAGIRGGECRVEHPFGFVKSKDVLLREQPGRGNRKALCWTRQTERK